MTREDLLKVVEETYKAAFHDGRALGVSGIGDISEEAEEILERLEDENEISIDYSY